MSKRSALGDKYASLDNCKIASGRSNIYEELSKLPSILSGKNLKDGI